MPIGLAGWGQEICNRLDQFLSPGTWINTVGPLPAYQRACLPPANASG